MKVIQETFSLNLLYKEKVIRLKKLIMINETMGVGKAKKRGIFNEYNYQWQRIYLYQ